VQIRSKLTWKGARGHGEKIEEKGGRGTESAATVRVATEETTRVDRGGCPENSAAQERAPNAEDRLEAAGRRAIG